MKKIVVIIGPTASGKTELAVKLALKINGEIISADSMQIYKGMDIGTAKPSLEQRKIVKHHMIDIISPIINYSVADFVDSARKEINDILNKDKTPIIVGGTGFYVESVIYDINFDKKEIDSKFKERMYKLSEKKGKKFVHNLLKNVDLKSYSEIHENNLKRVIRILEIYKSTKNTVAERNKNKSNLIYDCSIFGLFIERNLLYERINKRVDRMIEDNFLGEVKDLIKIGVCKDNTSMQAIGYREIFEYLENNNEKQINILPNEIIEKIKQKTRNYAKRQITWWKNKKVIWINFNNFDFEITIENLIKEIFE